MNKQELLNEYKKQDDKMCLSRIIDKIQTSKSKEKLEVTDFLDMYQVALVGNFLRKNKIQNYQLYGGYDEAERKVAIIFPQKFDEKMLNKNYGKILKIVRVLFI